MDDFFKSSDTAYRLMFPDAPDILKVKDVQGLLRIGRKKVYDLIEQGHLSTLPGGKGYLITKKSVIAYVLKGS